MTIRLPEDLLVKIQHKAEKLKLKKSDIVRLALSSFLLEEEDLSSPYERVSDLIGSIDTGINDLGQNHRKYLIRKLKKRA